MKEFTIKQVSSLTGLSIHTLRYYEQAGLLPEIRRAPNGHRRYTENDLAWIEIVTCLRGTEMSVADVQHYTQLAMEGDQTAGARRELLVTHKAQIQNQIRELQRVLSKIDGKIAYYARVEEEKEEKVS